jgi:hypothetical protein
MFRSPDGVFAIAYSRLATSMLKQTTENTGVDSGRGSGGRDITSGVEKVVHRSTR